uniref:Beta-glucosidase n=1 Tax=Lotharella globosa TaxID=91324 RepID=A0A7S4DS70_9EUKA
MPTGKLPVNKAGIEHYNKVIDALLKKGVQPFVTLYHWDYPQGLHEEYLGWLSDKSVDDFLLYAEICFKAFGDRVKYWLSFNEPWTFTFNGYGSGVHAPGRCSDRKICKHGNSSIEPYIAAHNVLKAHMHTVKVYRDKYQLIQGGRIGLTLNTDWAEPLTSSNLDAAAAERNMMFQFGWFAHPVFYGHYPWQMVERVGDRLPKFTKEESKILKGSLDFLGLNHYGSHYTKNIKGLGKAAAGAAGSPLLNDDFPVTGWAADMGVEVSFFRDGKDIGKPADSDWLHAAPWGFLKLLRWLNKTYSPETIFVTENGVDAPGENDKPLHEALSDTYRMEYYRDYIGAMRVAVEEGVPVEGYTAWSFMDNYEWADGYSKRFGIFYIDYKHNVTRYAKDSARWFQSFLKGKETTPAPEMPPPPPPPPSSKKETKDIEGHTNVKHATLKEDKDKERASGEKTVAKDTRHVHTTKEEKSAKSDESSHEAQDAPEHKHAASKEKEQAEPTEEPTKKPSREPTTHEPTHYPTDEPTRHPSEPTFAPTPKPTPYPTPKPTTAMPTHKPSKYPTMKPTPAPTPPTPIPTPRPTMPPTQKPTKRPTMPPTPKPTPLRTPKPTREPTNRPTHMPAFPTISPTSSAPSLATASLLPPPPVPLPPGTLGGQTGNGADDDTAPTSWMYYLIGVVGVASGLATLGAACVYCRKPRNNGYHSFFSSNTSKPTVGQAARSEGNKKTNYHTFFSPEATRENVKSQ